MPERQWPFKYREEKGQFIEREISPKTKERSLHTTMESEEKSRQGSTANTLDKLDSLPDPKSQSLIREFGYIGS